MGEVIDFPGETCLDIDPNKILTGALDALDEVVVIGYTIDGEFYLASSKGNGPDMLWLIELARGFVIGNEL